MDYISSFPKTNVHIFYQEGIRYCTVSKYRAETLALNQWSRLIIKCELIIANVFMILVVSISHRSSYSTF